MRDNLRVSGGVGSSKEPERADRACQGEQVGPGVEKWEGGGEGERGGGRERVRKK